ncbi:DeoR/GlpR family transcriptional regulator of sugar metabolism [Thermocatellispora tengchongensis]|uniref:DeoR/GlpR family transcriptional regulator of sugar metabolism n=1 Tax=Thermocatellispora tengchongensis TaxID=1073253 RepID=A0A840PJP1_9ACTN|nr:DeoR/GlpR family DNA-binding transcription regulator [Thermocatellispora tengchongensis]MBB5139748.1 DeoR/GlpR family transcriptional regulator of sugar metabolism [Thermocatellispora tengchongensis]
MSMRQQAVGAAARRQAMAEHVMRQGSASVTELADTFGVSVMTVHRDLDELERQGMVRKFRGGATAQASSVFESNIVYRLTANQEEKEAIARHVVRMIEPGSSVMLDDSTTALAVARHIGEVTPLTVVTNFLEGIKLLTGVGGVRLIALGGEYHPTHDSFLGVACVDAVEAMSTDLVIVSTSAISDRYAFHQEQEIVLVKRAMLNSGTRRVLAIDHSKLERVALHRVAPLDSFDLIVVDGRAPASAIDRLRERHLNVEVAEL